MRPLLQVHGAAEECYNSSHKPTRVLVGQSIERWKRRFLDFHSGNRMRNPENTCIVTAATAVLHTTATDLNESLADDTVFETTMAQIMDKRQDHQHTF